MIDVFLCSCPQSEERRQIAKRVLDWWKRKHEINLFLVSPDTVGCELEKFNRNRRIFAEGEAHSDPYIVADDDCVPLYDTQFEIDLRQAIVTMALHDDFALLSWLPSNCTINRWTPPDYQPFIDSEVEEHVSVGGIRMVRKGLTDWPASEGVGYDRTQADWLRSIGRRVGYFRHHRMVHIGEGKTELWKRGSATA